MITFQVESMTAARPELEVFAPIHWAELGLTKDDVPLDMDWTRYALMEEMNLIHMVSARDEGKLIGYQIALITPHLHYKSTLHAMVDLYYVKQEYRTGRTGLRLFEFAEKAYKELGVKKIITGCKTHLNHTRLFEFMGYTHSDQQFNKIL
jgi:hypothetical protein